VLETLLIRTGWSKQNLIDCTLSNNWNVFIPNHAFPITSLLNKKIKVRKNSCKIISGCSIEIWSLIRVKVTHTVEKSVKNLF
jgi:hypothetical protein